MISNHRKSNDEHKARMAAIHAEAIQIVATGRCPKCGSGLHRNNSLAGWWQCDRSGSGAMRACRS